MIERPPTFTPRARSPRARSPRSKGGSTLLSTGIVVGGAVALLVLFGELGYFSLPFVIAHLPDGVGPAEVSLQVTCYSFLVGFALAIPLGIVRAFPPRRAPGSTGPSGRWRRAASYPLYGFASGYVAAVRGTPFLVQMYLVYFLVIFAYPHLFLLGLGSAFWAGLLALTINTTGYQAEALRGGFQSVDASQIEAARALGMRRGGIFRRIILPQGLRLIILPLTNEWISNFKTSTILSYISFAELFYWAHVDVAGRLARPIEGFLMIAVFYLVINVTFSRCVTYLEERWRTPGLGSVAPERIARAG